MPNQIYFLYFCFIWISTTNGYFITLTVSYSWLSLGIFIECTKFCFLFLLFRVSSYCRSKRCQTQTASLPTRSPGQYSKVLTARMLVNQLFKFTAVGQMGRLDETHSPTKKLPPESTPQVMFTGFEHIQVQQYTKVFFDSISKTDMCRCLTSSWLQLHIWWCICSSIAVDSCFGRWNSRKHSENHSLGSH